MRCRAINERLVKLPSVQLRLRRDLLPTPDNARPHCVRLRHRAVLHKADNGLHATDIAARTGR